VTGAARIRADDPPHGRPAAAPTPPEWFEWVLMPNGRPRNPLFVGRCYLCGAPISKTAWFCRGCRGDQ